MKIKYGMTLRNLIPNLKDNHKKNEDNYLLIHIKFQKVFLKQ